MIIKKEFWFGFFQKNLKIIPKRGEIFLEKKRQIFKIKASTFQKKASIFQKNWN